MNGSPKYAPPPGNDQLEPCELCDGTARLTVAPKIVRHKAGEKTMEIAAMVPSWHCETCGSTYTADGAEQAEHDAVCAHLERMVSREIVKLRARLDLTQAALGKRLGVSRVTVARWETGAQVQSPGHEEALRRLAAGDSTERRKWSGKFKTDIEARRLAASAFQLTA